MSSDLPNDRLGGAGAARRVLCAALVGALTLTLGACGLRQRLVESVVPLSGDQLEELASFHCVTLGTVEQATEAFRPGDNGYAAAVRHYHATREPFNTLVGDLARDVEQNSEVDVDTLEARLAAARTERQQFLAYVEDASGFGFIGLETLLGLATPYARRVARRFVDERVREYAANQLREQLLLPEFDEVDSAECLEEGRESGGVGAAS